MTAAQSLEGDNTTGTTRLEELHALIEALHEEERAANRAAVFPAPPSPAVPMT